MQSKPKSHKNLCRIIKDRFEIRDWRSVTATMSSNDEIWDNFGKDFLTYIFNFMPRHIDLCIAANGGRFKY